MTDTAEALRTFNRRYTQRIGVLDDRFLGLDRPLAASRLLWEIGEAGRAVADLRQILGVDSAYLSRLLRRLEADGLATTTGDPLDGRRRRAVLTTAGRNEWHRIETRSQMLAEDIIEPLSQRQRRSLTEALETADRLLTAAAVVVSPVDPADVEAVAALGRYFDELNHRFDGGFDPGDAIIADADSFRQPNGAFLLARDSTSRPDGVSDPVGCGAVHRLDHDVAEIKRMWINPVWRGLGLGRRLLAQLEQTARNLGCSTVRLDTNSVLTEAIAMYRSNGYEPIDRYNDNPFARCWFEKPL